MVSGCHNGSVRAWDLRTFQLLNDMPAHRLKYDEGILSIAQSGNGFIATGGSDSIVKIIQT